jgi:hypothetical protein
MYSDPLIFRPERFLGPNPETDPDFVFGFGRRVCAGQVLAQTSVYIFAAHLLALFDILPARGPDGELVEVKVEFDGQGSVACVYALRFQVHVRKNADADSGLRRIFHSSAKCVLRKPRRCSLPRLSQ